MSLVPRKSLAEGVAAHVRQAIAEGRWVSRMPGLRPLATELGVSIKVLRKAFAMLEAEGVLSPPDRGDARRILRVPEAGGARRILRVVILLPQPLEAEPADTQSLLLRLVSAIAEAGHHGYLLPLPPGAAPGKAAVLARVVGSENADAWIVYHGCSATLAWFAERRLKALAYAGRGDAGGLPAVFCDASDAVRQAVRRLVELGHRRIVLICPTRSRGPTPAPFLKALRDELAAAGITPGEYNTPDWRQSPQGLRELLGALFAVTPPTAFIILGNNYVSGVLSFLAARGLRVPEDVSLISSDLESAFEWQCPGIRPAHFDDRRELMRKWTLRWLDDLSLGRPPATMPAFRARFVPGGTVSEARLRVAPAAEPVSSRSVFPT